MTKIDLVTQTQGVLTRLHGGTSNTIGAANEQVIAPFLNDSGGTLALGTVVTRSTSDPKLHAAGTAGEKIVGVVVGRYHPSIDLFQAIAPTADQTAAVCIMGRCNVLTASAAVRGQFLRASGTAGQAGVSTGILSGTFGYVLYQITTSVAQALIGQMETGGGALGDGWFNVRTYGATGDGATNDTTAINAAIAALNAYGRGVLYFPAGTYITSGGLTTISVPASIRGDGTSSSISGPNSKVTCTSATASLFTVSADGCVFRDIGLINTHGTATAGAGILTTGGELAEFESLRIESFFTGIDLENSVVWTMRGCWISDVRKYGIRIRNTAVPDAGDWSISDSWFGTTHTADAGILINSSGGGKITNCKINGATQFFATGIDVAIGTGASTSVLLVSNCSIENVTGDGIRITTTGTGRFASIAITSCQFGLYANNSGRGVKISAANTGSWVNGSIADIVIDGDIFYTDGTARAAVALTNCDNIVLGDLSLDGFNARYTSSAATNITDNSLVGSSSFATPAIVLGTAAAAGAATTVIRSDSTIVAFDATVPVTQAFSDAAATGSAAFAARRDHKHGMPADSVTHGDILIADSPSTPLVFADLLQDDAQTDLMYADL